MEHATVSVSTAVSIIFALLAAASTIFSILVKFSFATYQKNVDDRHAALTTEIATLKKASDEDEKELKKEVKALTEANHALDKVCIKLSGDVTLLTDRHATSKSDIESIREHMVTKAEWDPRMAAVEKTLNTILLEVRERSRGGYGAHPSYGSLTRPPIPRGESNPPPKGSRT